MAAQERCGSSGVNDLADQLPLAMVATEEPVVIGLERPATWG
jgi:hypothetical protein